MKQLVPGMSAEVVKLECPGPPRSCARDGICPVHGLNREGQTAAILEEP